MDNICCYSWKLVKEEDDLEAIDRLIEQFAFPLQGAQADTYVIKMEFGNMIEYAVQYSTLPSLLLITTLCGGDFHAPNSAEWSNV